MATEIMGDQPDQPQLPHTTGARARGAGGAGVRLDTLGGFWTKINNDWIFNLAGLLAYNFLMALFPLLLLLLAGCGVVLQVTLAARRAATPAYPGGRASRDHWHHPRAGRRCPSQEQRRAAPRGRPRRGSPCRVPAFCHAGGLLRHRLPTARSGPAPAEPHGLRHAGPLPVGRAHRLPHLHPADGAGRPRRPR